MITSKTKLYFFVIYIVIFTSIEGDHFQGGTITYKVLKTYDSIVSISITQTYLYANSRIPCNDKKILKQSPSLFRNSTRMERWATLNCTQYCNQSDGFEPIPINTFCTDYSKALDITVGQRSDIINITNGSYFLLTSKGKSWRQFNTPKGTLKSGTWSIPCLINLQIRSNGEYNHPPVSAMIFPIYIYVGIENTIFIPVFDADFDEVRCRFAEGPDECGGACHSVALPKGTNLLPDCVLLITGANAGDWYAATIMIEDFADYTSTIPFSSVSVQFLIHVQNETNCSSPYLMSFIDEPDQCADVFIVNQSRTIELLVQHDCSNSTTIQDIATLSFPNIIKKPIIQIESSFWLVSLIWTPTVAQIGSQMLCAVAIDSENVQSDPYCMIFKVVEGNISPCPKETTIPTTESEAIESTSISTTIETISEELLTSSYDHQVLIDTTISPIVNVQQTTMTPLVSTIKTITKSTTRDFQKSLNTAESTDSVIDSNETSMTTILSPEALMSSLEDQQISSTPTSIITSSCPNSSSPWRWAAPLIAILAASLITVSIVFCCYHRSWCCFKDRQKLSPRKNITQQGKNIYPPKRPYRVYNAFENKKNPRANNIRNSLHNINKHTSRITPTSTPPPPPPLNNVQVDTPISVTQSYLFGNRKL